MDNVLTETCTHKNNPTGTTLATVATGIACSPIDPLDKTYTQAYPIDKLFLMRQSFTKYTAFVAGDYLVADSTTYAIKAVHPWPALGSLDLYYHLILEYTDINPVVSLSDEILGLSPIAYWPLWETEGEYAECLACTPGQNGEYTGVTLANALGPSGAHYAPFFDGANDYVNCHSAILAAAFNGLEGTIAIWAKVNAVGVWTDGANRYAFQLNSDVAEYIRMYKSSTNNRMSYRYRAGGVTEAGDEDGLTVTDWMHLAMTWSLSAGTDGEVRYWRDGAEVAVIDTALGTWVGAVMANYPLIGAASLVPGSPWHGWLAHCAIWDRALTQPEITALATV